MPRTPKASLTLGIDLAALRELIRALREEGVTRAKLENIELDLAAMPPMRALEDFATTGDDLPMVDDDDRYAHVGIKLRSNMTEPQ